MNPGEDRNSRTGEGNRMSRNPGGKQKKKIAEVDRMRKKTHGNEKRGWTSIQMILS